MMLTVFVCISFSLFTPVSGICPLCATPADLPKRWEYRISDGRSCRDIYLELGGVSETSAKCYADKKLAQQSCCSDQEPSVPSYTAAPAPIGTYNGPHGSEPDCPICTTMEYPGLPNAFIVARYVGEFTCDQLYWRGLNGMTPGFMCGPLQDFAFPICGCGKYNPKCTANPSYCWGNPSPQPVAQSVPAPQPVAQPVAAPAPRPTTNYQPSGGLFDRKTPPEGGKYSQKLSGRRGGAAGGGIGGSGRRGEATSGVKYSDSLLEVNDPKPADSVSQEEDDSAI